MSYQHQIPSSDSSNDCVNEHFQIDSGAVFSDENATTDIQEVSSASISSIEEEKATYFRLIRFNRPYRLYLASYLVARAGDWFNYVACITAIEDILGPDSESTMTAVSLLVIVRLLPNILLSSVGGALADAVDRRKCLMVLDFSAAAVVLLYSVACWMKSIPLIYLVTFILESMAALSEPNKTALVPLLVPDEEFLKKGMTLSILAWSAMAAVGSSLGGFAVSLLGIQACFAIDSVSFIFSALLLWRIGGTWTVADTKERRDHEPLWSEFVRMTVDGVQYISRSSFAPYVFLKLSAALVFGASDVLNAAFSQQSGKDEAGNSKRLGILFASAGIGCLIGPLVADPVTDMKNPRSLLQACVVSLGFVTIGYFGLAFFAPFISICLFSAVRAAGSAVLWVDSTLILQVFSAPEMLGRVTAVDYALATMGEATSAFLAGVLQDNFGLTAEGVSLAMAVLGLILSVAWLPLMLKAGSHEEATNASVPENKKNQAFLDPSEGNPLLP
uniref:Major facilitator superfamily (MFS) profile domain-containing protein n=1 Tax=Pseudictyota dubia TaxID=2749911 RepID=A0A7R9W1B8_9STRA|mmetsp:Transcript_28209/g.52517  ORF Transcript_28209/g.52517 Transcript_28209/m.52517 type:complete len:502 (+) Transcript_28209:118-1623(+)|eukprot:CAMPEP_0197449658 /NCGR_PEP_ID=MMETSP1175-20131217/22401_1 /TAXON_ID=1003142 /ORGANISM="Triceratium dubium, Strain CCMP147" /LENGTH=501 /DNA_ID=CAMNT_0042981859 /DNA_START=117 /DNA_END=1622 /DNA_ORIENTATION=+